MEGQSAELVGREIACSEDAPDDGSSLGVPCDTRIVKSKSEPQKLNYSDAACGPFQLAALCTCRRSLAQRASGRGDAAQNEPSGLELDCQKLRSDNREQALLDLPGAQVGRDANKIDGEAGCFGNGLDRRVVEQTAVGGSQTLRQVEHLFDAVVV